MKYKPQPILHPSLLKTHVMKYYLLYLGIAAATLCGCKKFLDAKPDKQLVIPATLQDAEALLDNQTMNSTAGLGEASADNYYLLYSDWQALPNVQDRNTYVWEKEIFFDGYPNA
jgi:hypothetical protein